ncbi:MAG: hypothetical protein H6Q64_2023 [Firmicutes bacterium]|nr:hypothetical protein [Bacillota bacterium]
MVQEQGRKLWLMLAVCIYLNLLDLLATLSFCQSWGWELELNPVMRYFFTIDPLLGAFIKMAAVLLFVIAVQYAAYEHFVRVYRGTFFVTFIYTSLFGWHMLNWGINY